MALRAVLVLFSCVILVSSISPQCEFEDRKRFDCFPETGATQEKCEARGCCWAPPSRLTGSAPLDTPYCFYPSNYGYHATTSTKTPTGFVVDLVREGSKGPYGADVMALKADFRLETETRLRVKIYDPNNQRYEVPIPTPKVAAQSPSQIYDVSFTSFPFGFAVKRKATNTVIFNSTAGGMIFEDQFLQMSHYVSSENIYGLGEHAKNLKLDMSWQMFSLFSSDHATPHDNSNLYGVHPFYVNVENDGNANGVFLLNSNAMDIILQPSPAVTYRTIGGILDFYIFLGPSPANVVEQYTDVIGRPILPPYWGLGFHLCRWGYRTLDRMKDVVYKLRSLGFPQDVQWNDIDYMTEHEDFTYNKTSFSGLPEFIDDLHNHGQHYILMTDPGIKSVSGYPPWDEGVKEGVFVQYHDGGPLIGKVWPGETGFPDFFNPATTTYWLKQLSSFHDQLKFDGLWIDMNEPSNFVTGSIKGCPESSLEKPPYTPHIFGGTLAVKTVCMTAKHYQHLHYDVHSLYGYSEMIATNSALQQIRGKRTVVISRSTYPNSGSHGGHWLGDNVSQFGDLSISIPGILNFNLFGIPLVGADICGFNGNTNEELCTRWMQLGAFYPFSRNHNTLNANPQDPSAFSQQMIDSSRGAMLTRYSLLPYLYTLFYQAHTAGSTVARPLFFEFPADKNTLAIDQQFLWGAALLITPVVAQGTTVKGYFPQATWYDFFEKSPYEASGKFVTLNTPLDKINLHVRGGYILPMQQPNTTTTTSRKNPYSLLVALDGSSEATGQLFLDDGESIDSVAKKAYSLINFMAKENMLTSTVSMRGYEPSAPLSTIDIMGVAAPPQHVTVNGKTTTTFHYDQQKKLLMIVDLSLVITEPVSVMWQ